jgi:hypothetical protein
VNRSCSAAVRTEISRHFFRDRELQTNIAFRRESRQLSRYSDWVRAGRPRSRDSSFVRVNSFHSISSGPALGPGGKAACTWICTSTPPIRFYGVVLGYFSIGTIFTFKTHSLDTPLKQEISFFPGLRHIREESFLFCVASDRLWSSPSPIHVHWMRRALFPGLRGQGVKLTTVPI